MCQWREKEKVVNAQLFGKQRSPKRRCSLKVEEAKLPLLALPVSGNNTCQWGLSADNYHEPRS